MNILASTLALATLIVLGIVVFRRRFPYGLRLAASVVLWTLLLAPSLVPATVAGFPAPFAVILAIGIFGGVMHEVIELVTLFAKWHAISFPVTAIVVYLISRKVLSNPRIQADAHVGSARG